MFFICSKAYVIMSDLNIWKCFHVFKHLKKLILQVFLYIRNTPLKYFQDDETIEIILQLNTIEIFLIVDYSKQHG